MNIVKIRAPDGRDSYGRDCVHFCGAWISLLGGETEEVSFQDAHPEVVDDLSASTFSQTDDLQPSCGSVWAIRLFQRTTFADETKS